jgi:hypothetical protein
MPTLAELAGYGDDPSTTGGGLLGLLTSFIDNRKRGLLNNVQGGPGLLGTRINESARDFNREERSWMGAERSVIPELRDMAGQRTLNQALNMGGLLGLHTVYHGSPHKFDKFDASKIGTGEGAQAYGHGLYFAENPAVAKQYSRMAGVEMRDKAGNAVPIDEGVQWVAKDLDEAGGNFTKVRAALKEHGKTWPWPAEMGQAALDKWERAGAKPASKGKTYKADLPDEWLPKMLDWDKPLSQQPANVRSALEQLGEKLGDSKLRKGSTALGLLESRLGGRDKASAALRDAGVPGVKYQDGGSRGTEGGTHNYVVFPGMEKYLKILGIE